jgi:hypothetical protein
LQRCPIAAKRAKTSTKGGNRSYGFANPTGTGLAFYFEIEFHVHSLENVCLAA